MNRFCNFGAVKSSDMSARIATPYNLHVEYIWKLDVVYILALSEEKSFVLFAKGLLDSQQLRLKFALQSRIEKH